MVRAVVVTKDPKINIKKESNDCRCILMEVTTSGGDTISFQFDNINDAKAFHGLLGFALDG